MNSQTHQSSVPDTNSLRLQQEAAVHQDQNFSTSVSSHLNFIHEARDPPELTLTLTPPFTYITRMYVFLLKQVQQISAPTHQHLCWTGPQNRIRLTPPTVLFLQVYSGLEEETSPTCSQLKMKMTQHLFSECFCVSEGFKESNVDQDAASTFSSAPTVFYYSFQRKKGLQSVPRISSRVCVLAEKLWTGFKRSPDGRRAAGVSSDICLHLLEEETI